MDKIIIDEVDVIACEASTEGCQLIRFEWSGNIGFGQYDLLLHNTEDKNSGYTITNKIEGFSEHLDGDNKQFLRALFDKLIERVEVVD